MRSSLATDTASIAGHGSQLAACAAVLCGVHCALAPVLVLAMPTLALSEGVERSVFLGTLVLGAIVLALGPGRGHPTIVATFASGALVWAGSLWGWLEPLPEPVGSTIGSLILAVALMRSSIACRLEGCEVCRERDTEPTPARD